MKDLKIFLVASLLLISCGTRKVTLDKQHHESTLDSAGHQVSTIVRSAAADSTGSSSIHLVKVSEAESKVTDTGSVVWHGRTIIQAKFATGTGPTPAQVSAAAGDSIRTGHILDHATEITITTDGRTIQKKGFTETKKQAGYADSVAAATSNVKKSQVSDSTGKSDTDLHKQTVDDTENKNTERKGIPPGVQWALIIAGIGLAVYLLTRVGSWLISRFVDKN